MTFDLEKRNNFRILKKDASFQSGLDDPIILDMIFKKINETNRKTFASFAFRSFFSCGSVFFGKMAFPSCFPQVPKKQTTFGGCCLSLGMICTGVIELPKSGDQTNKA